MIEGEYLTCLAIRLHKAEGLSFKNVITFNLDEYFPMGPDELQSYKRFMCEHLFDHVDILRPQFDALVRMYEEGKLHPFVDKTFSFADAAAAHQYLHDRKARGKLLLVP